MTTAPRYPNAPCEEIQMNPHLHNLVLLQQAYRDMHAEHCGPENGIPAANDALETARLAQVTTAGTSLLIGTWVLVWNRGRALDGTRTLIAWHPTLDLDLLHDAEKFVQEWPT